ncbi:MAG: ferrous iron transport protein A [Betaproteobacteria bacterium]|nr:ferrous iron transport protein A [Betaproteobacteria bacterium]
MTLDQAPLASTWRVLQMTADRLALERRRQLEEIGFLPGELVTVMRRAMPGGDPMVVRVGLSTFALRGAEARCILIAENHAHG